MIVAKFPAFRAPVVSVMPLPMARDLKAFGWLAVAASLVLMPLLIWTLGLFSMRTALLVSLSILISLYATLVSLLDTIDVHEFLRAYRAKYDVDSSHER